MKRFRLPMVVILLAVAGVCLASCSQARKMAMQKVREEKAKYDTRENATRETCDKAMGIAHNAEEEEAFQERMGEIFKPCGEAGTWAECDKAVRENVTELYKEAVRKAGANEACVGILTDVTIEGVHEKVRDKFPE